MTEPQTTLQTVSDRIIDFVLTDFPTDYTAESLPVDQSLLELGVIDSMGVIELVEFLERTWSIVIDESEITHEKMGGVTKMATLVMEKVGGSGTQG